MRKLLPTTALGVLLLSSALSNGDAATLPGLRVKAPSLASRAQSLTEVVLTTFTSSTYEANLASPLIPDGVGNYYGTTEDGGEGYGTVYELSPDRRGGWKQTTIYSFEGFYDGRNPVLTPLVLDAKTGDIYGETAEGGPNNSGVVFRLQHKASGWTETALYDFGVPGSVGTYPYDALLRDSSGNLYGCAVTIEGLHFTQIVFELSPPSGSGVWTGQIIYTVGVVSASNANCGLVMDATGNIFGVAAGLIEPASAFELSRSGSTWTPRILYAFKILHSYPLGAPVLDKAGNLYGTMFGGEANTKNGAVYRLSPSKTGQWTKRILYAFKGGTADGSGPYAGVTFDASGNLYGTTVYGGATDNGTVFELSATGGRYAERLLWSFDGADGALPFSPVVVDSVGNVFGTTTAGGGGGNKCYAQAGCGNAFEITTN